MPYAKKPTDCCAAVACLRRGVARSMLDRDIEAGGIGAWGSSDQTKVCLGGAKVVTEVDPEMFPRLTPWRTAIALSALFLFDLVVLGQGGFAILVASFGLSMLTIGALWSAIRGHWALARGRAIRAAMYLFLGVASVVTLRFHEATARNGARQIIAACEAYKRHTGNLPDRLDQLVPVFLPKVPVALYTVLYNDFWYFSEYALLTYVVFPPFGRRVYDFNTTQWNYLD